MVAQKTEEIEQQNPQIEKQKQENKVENLENPMRKIYVEKLVLHIGTGKEVKDIERGTKLLRKFTDQKIAQTTAKKRIATWGIRPGMPIGVMATIRGKKALELIPKFLSAKDNVLKESNFDNYGNVNFGIAEYIEIPGIKYDPEIEIMGLQVTIALRRKGQRVATRKRARSKVGKNHIVKKEEAIKFMEETFGIKVEG